MNLSCNILFIEFSNLHIWSSLYALGHVLVLQPPFSVGVTGKPSHHSRDGSMSLVSTRWGGYLGMWYWSSGKVTKYSDSTKTDSLWQWNWLSFLAPVSHPFGGGRVNALCCSEHHVYLVLDTDSGPFLLTKDKVTLLVGLRYTLFTCYQLITFGSLVASYNEYYLVKRRRGLY